MVTSRAKMKVGCRYNIAPGSGEWAAKRRLDNTRKKNWVKPFALWAQLLLNCQHITMLSEVGDAE